MELALSRLLLLALVFLWMYFCRLMSLATIPRNLDDWHFLLIFKTVYSYLYIWMISVFTVFDSLQFAWKLLRRSPLLSTNELMYTLGSTNLNLSWPFGLSFYFFDIAFWIICNTLLLLEVFYIFNYLWKIPLDRKYIYI